MTPTEFVLWFNGATGVIGEDGPTPEQWAVVREKLGEAIGKITADRLLERAEESVRKDSDRRRMEGYLANMGAASKNMSNPLFRGGGLTGPTEGTTIEVPEVPMPRNPGLLNRILGKAPHA